jgi:hypothetical protein
VIRGGDGDAPRVLVIADGVRSYVAAWRVHAPLAALKRSGRIAAYTVTDATLIGLPRRAAFDIVYLQRAVDTHLVRRLADFLPRAFLLDIDDHLLCRPDYLRPQEFPSPESVLEGLKAARVITVTSARLGSLLSQRSGLELADRLVVCPNAAGFPRMRGGEPRQPEALLLTQGHRFALTASAPAVLASIGDFATRHRLPICYLGPPLERLSPLAARLLPDVVQGGETDFAAYHRLLDSLPTMLAVAPLETAGSTATVEFVAGKSDVKMVEYGGYAHPAVLSDAAPYTDSDLGCGFTVANTYEAWSAGLEAAWEDGWHSAAADRTRVRMLRNIETVAERSWAPALDAARLDRPVESRAIYGVRDRVKARVRTMRSRAAWHVWQAQSRTGARSESGE